jgi:hypothetical protein
VSSATYRVANLAPEFDLDAFDCGEPAYNEWLTRHARAAVGAGSAAVYVLLAGEGTGGDERVVGYYAICPTLVVRDEVPKQLQRGLLRAAPGWLLAKLAVDVSRRGDKENRWGSQLLRDALERIIASADAGGGQIIVVDADSEDLVGWYSRHGFLPTGAANLRLFMKVATARRYLRDG